MYKSLSHFIEILEQNGELVRIKTKVSTSLEIAELTDRESKSPCGGRALLFEDCGFDFPVITNMLGSEKRICLALGVQQLSELSEGLSSLFIAGTAPKSSFKDKLKMLPLLLKASKWMPKRKRGFGECQQMMQSGENVDLNSLPILKCAPSDAERFVTLPLVHTINPETGQPNVGMYRMQVLDSKTTALHWHKHKTGEKHYQQYKKMGKIMPVSVALGGNPAHTYSATAPLPDGIDEYMLSGYISNSSVKLVKSITNDIYVPADCDFVIEGYVDPSEEKFYEGPFGDHTGFYSLEDYYPKFHVTCITHRKNAIYPATLVGIPPMEDYYIGRATETIFLAPIRAVIQPDLKDMWLPMEGVAHNLAILNIEKSYAGQGGKVASAMWGAGQMMFNKIAVTIDIPSSLRDLDVLKSQISNISIPEDIIILKGTLDVLDHTADATGFGGKLSIDATPKCEEEGVREAVSCSISENISPNWCSKYAKEGWATIFGYFDGKSSFKEEAQKVSASINGVKFAILLDKELKKFPISDKIWILFSNCDMFRDSFVFEGTLFLDGRSKCGKVNGFARRWPNVVVMDEKTVDMVDKKWAEYGIGEFLPSPAKKYRALLKSDKADV